MSTVKVVDGYTIVGTNDDGKNVRFGFFSSLASAQKQMQRTLDQAATCSWMNLGTPEFKVVKAQAEDIPFKGRFLDGFRENNADGAVPILFFVTIIGALIGLGYFLTGTELSSILSLLSIPFGFLVFCGVGGTDTAMRFRYKLLAP